MIFHFNQKHSSMRYLCLLIAFITCFSAIAQNDSTLNNKGKMKLKLLSWNIFMLPQMVKFTKKKERAHEIGQMLKNSDYDVVVLQEAFMRKARRIIEKETGKSFPYRVGPANWKRFSLKTHSGVWILSRVPIRKLGETRFKFCSGISDCMARKGATMVEGEKNGKKFHLIGTHLQAEDYPQTRKKQFRQIFDSLILKFQRKDVPLLISGDLNTPKDDAENYKDMLQTLDAEDGNLGEDSESQSTYNLNYDKKTDSSQFQKQKNLILDYILLRKNGKKVKSQKRKVRIFKAGKNKKMFLSDHFALEMEIEMD